MQACAFIYSECSHCHFLTVYDNTYIILYYAKIFCTYVKDLWRKMDFKMKGQLQGQSRERHHVNRSKNERRNFDLIEIP